MPLRLLPSVIHLTILRIELARSFERKASIRASERASSSWRSGEQRGQEVRQSGKKAGERVLGFAEVGGKSGSGGECKVSFRSRRSLARTPARSLARVAEASHRQSSTRFRGVAVADGIISRISGPACLDPRDFSPPADARTSGRPLPKWPRAEKTPPGFLVRSEPFSGGACSQGLFFLDDDVDTETPWIGSSNRADRKEDKRKKRRTKRNRKSEPGNLSLSLSKVFDTSDASKVTYCR